MKFKHIIWGLILIGFNSKAQENLKYQKPSKEILALAEYERAPSVTMDTKKEWLLLSYRNTYKSLDELNQEEMRLGGLRINPITNIGSTVTYINNLKVRRIKDKNEIQVQGLPENPKIATITWSPDEQNISFTHTTSNGVELWVLNLATAKATRLTNDNLNANLGNPINWFKDSKHLLVKMIPNNRPALIDTKKDLPNGPITSNSEGKTSQNRTYQDLLKNQTDEANFSNLITSELYKVSLNGQKELFKKADLYTGESFSPDGNYIIITTIHKPFSYVVPLNRFPQKTVVYDNSGNEIKIVNEVPLNEIVINAFNEVLKLHDCIYLI